MWAEIRVRASILLRQLDQRGLAVDPAERRRILQRKDAGKLELWQDRVLTARRTADLFV